MMPRRDHHAHASDCRTVTRVPRRANTPRNPGPVLRCRHVTCSAFRSSGSGACRRQQRSIHSDATPPSRKPPRANVRLVDELTLEGNSISLADRSGSLTKWAHSTSPMYSEDTLLRLIERIYDAALAPELWPMFLEGLSEVVDGHRRTSPTRKRGGLSSLSARPLASTLRHCVSLRVAIYHAVAPELLSMSAVRGPVDYGFSDQCLTPGQRSPCRRAARGVRPLRTTLRILGHPFPFSRRERIAQARP